jgi:hypothetical protein
LERLQARDGVGQVRAPVYVVLASRRDHEPATGGLRGGGYTLDRSLERVELVVLAARVVLHRAAREPGVDREPHGLPHRAGIIRETVLEVGVHRQLRGAHDGRGVRQRLVARHRAVEPAERGRVAAARGGECLEAERREQLCRAHVPGVRQQ